MTGPDLDVVRQSSNALQRPEERARRLLDLLSGHGEIGSRHIPDKQRIAAEHEARVLAARGVGDEERHVLGSMPGCRKRLQPHRTDLNARSPAQQLVGGRDAAAGRKVCNGTCRRDQPVATRDVIGVHMRVDNMANNESVGASERQVRLDIQRGIDHDRLAAIGKKVGRTGEILVDDLPEDHAARPLATGESPDGGLA